MWAREEDIPSVLESLRGDDEEEDEDREEGEVTPPPHSPLPKDLPLLGDIFSRQAGIFVGPRRLKWRQPSQPRLALVSPDLQGMSIVLAIAIAAPPSK
jgi:hypothetical protein